MTYQERHFREEVSSPMAKSDNDGYVQVPHKERWNCKCGWFCILTGHNCPGCKKIG